MFGALRQEKQNSTQRLRASVGISYVRVLTFFGFEVTFRLVLDSSTALGTRRREGAGRVKRIEIKALWCQHMVKRGIVEVGKVSTVDNRSDLGTKPLHGHWLRYLRKLCGLHGRSLEEGQYLADTF